MWKHRELNKVLLLVASLKSQLLYIWSPKQRSFRTITLQDYVITDIGYMLRILISAIRATKLCCLRRRAQALVSLAHSNREQFLLFWWPSLSVWWTNLVIRVCCCQKNCEGCEQHWKHVAKTGRCPPLRPVRLFVLIAYHKMDHVKERELRTVEDESTN